MKIEDQIGFVSLIFHLTDKLKENLMIIISKI